MLTVLIVIAVLVALAVLRQHSRSLTRLRREVLTMRRVLEAMPEYQVGVDAELTRVGIEIGRRNPFLGEFVLRGLKLDRQTVQKMSDEWKRDHGIPTR